MPSGPQKVNRFKSRRWRVAPILTNHIRVVDPVQRLARLRFLVSLLNPDRVTAADRTATQYGGINTDVDLVVLGCCTQDAWIPG